LYDDMSKISQHIFMYYSHLGSVSPTFTQMLKIIFRNKYILGFNSQQNDGEIEVDVNHRI